MSRKTKSKKKKRQKQIQRHIPNWVAPAVLIGLIVGTFLVRTLPQWNLVFQQGLVIFKGVDPWYHMRLADNMMANFPIPLSRDMNILFPDGKGVGYFPLLSWMIALPGQVFNYEVVGALIPPILGALTLIPIYLICKTLWKNWVGLIACLFIMILPSEFFHRSLLGFTDHHVLEAFFMAWTILFLVLYTKVPKLKWVILAGISLGLYMASWIGALLLVAIIWIWFLITFIHKLRKKESVNKFCYHLLVIFGIGFLLYAPNGLVLEGLTPFILAMGAVTLSPLILLGLSKAFNWKLTLGLVTIGLIVGGLLFQHLYPGILWTLRSLFGNVNTTIQEVIPSGPRTLMAHYGITFLLFAGGLVFAIRKRQNLILLVWCIILLILAINQRRWGYYFVLADGILAAYFIYLISGWFHKQVRVAVVVVIVGILLFTTIPGTIAISHSPGILNSDWYNACVWIRNNTPEIEGYYELNAKKPAYGILSWWDYGNWICRIGRRAPVSNPMSQTPSTQWQIFLAHNETEVEEYAEGINYIVVSEWEVTTKFYAIVHLSHLKEITWKPFIMQLWEGAPMEGWQKIQQIGKVKIYGRI